jgi:hypothetical protein
MACPFSAPSPLFENPILVLANTMRIDPRFIAGVIVASWTIGVGMGTWLSGSKAAIARRDMEIEHLTGRVAEEFGKREWMESLADASAQSTIKAANEVNELRVELNRTTVVGRSTAAVSAVQAQTPLGDESAALDNIREILHEQGSERFSRLLNSFSDKIGQHMREISGLRNEQKGKEVRSSKALLGAGNKLAERDAEILRLKTTISELESGTRAM